MQYILLVTLAFALAAIQILIGGVTLVYALPSYCLVAVAGLGALAYPGRTECFRSRQICVISTLALAAYVFLRSCFSPVAYLARGDFFLILAAVVVYFLTAIHLTGSRQRLALVWMLFFVALLHVVVGAVQFKSQDDYMLLPWIFRPVYWFRASGFYLSPNHLAGMLEMLGMMLLSTCVWARGPFAMRAFAAYGFLACVGGVAMTGSRTGYLSMFIAVLLFIGISLSFVYHMRRREFWTFTLVAGILFGTLMSASLFFMVRSEVLSNRIGHMQGAGSARLLLWPAAIQQFQLNQTFGTGSGTYLIYGRQFRQQTVTHDPQHVHNDYLELLSEYGLIGAALMTAFLLLHFLAGSTGLRRVILRKLRHGSRTKSNEMALLTGAICGTTAIVIHSITDYNLHVPANALFVAFLFGIIANPTAEAVNPTRIAARRWLRFVAPAAGALLLLTAWPAASRAYPAERARIALRNGDLEEARAFAENALQRDRKNPDLYFYLALNLNSVAEHAQDAGERTAAQREAIATLEAGLKVFPQDVRLWLELANTHDQLGQFDQAEAAFQRGLALDPSSSDLYAYYGYHWQLQDQLPKAMALYEKSRRLSGQYVPDKATGSKDGAPGDARPGAKPDGKRKPVRKPPFFQ